MFDLFGNAVIAQTQCKVTEQNGALVVQTPYNPQFVALIKSLPASARRFDPGNKAWLVDTQYAKRVRDWVLQIYHEDIGTIITSNNQQQLEIRVLDVWYLGRTKPAGDEYQATGMNARKEWVFIFPESALRNWFEGSVQYINTTTLYSILGIQRTAMDEDIKAAYRRMVKQWHPDVCKEPNAQDMFIRIKEAYELLSNPTKRARYDAGLVLEASLQQNADKLPDITGYRAPLRCGYILAEGYECLGRFYVQKILGWEDITSEKGTLVASWPAGANKPVWQWIG
ncbi:MAG: DnaJ domain-containing protein [Anaerolineae bacterium]|nr:DnaJ domain-containing protein [Anaerolineae bacterium]